MDINIIKGEPAHLEDCYEALMKSGIGQAYFSTFDARIILKRGLANGEIDAAVDKENRCMGFIWYERHGAFGAHTYLHIIAVKEEYRRQGIGKKLIANFERKTFEDDNMIFLMVADFNQEAEKLYERLGYIHVGDVPGFYRKEIVEHLMMKLKPMV
jgi:ribosomal protein S18 acetylase RimI-like enzyme